MAETEKEQGIKLIRIFVSSPGDMNVERELVMGICRRAQGQYSAYFRIEPYYWENAPMYASKDYQDNIEPPANFDLYLGMLWSRLGTPLDQARHHRKDGSGYDSGTEFEFENALEAYFASNKSRPELLIYHRVAIPNIPLDPAAEHDKRYKQYQLVKQFIAKWTHDPNDSDVFRAAINTYKQVDEFELHFENALQDFLKRKLPENAVLQPVISWTQGSPFRGLSYFDYEHSSIYYGRTKAIYEILQALESQFQEGRPFILVSGSSGVGKSSLIRAGLMPQLLRPDERYETAIWRYAELRVADLRPGQEDLFDLLARSLLQNRIPGIKSRFSAQSSPTYPPALPEISDAADVLDLANQLRQNPAKAIESIEKALIRISQKEKERRHEENLPTARLCLLLDQIEEIFTINGIKQEDAEKFFHLIRALVESKMVFVVATMRSDFISSCEQIADLMLLKKENGNYHLEPPTPYEIGRIIRLPAQSAGLVFEKNENDIGLDEVLHEAMRQSGKNNAESTALPLLEFTLQALYERARLNADETKRHILSFSDYEALGGLEGSIARKSEDTFLGLSPDAQKAFEKIMPHMARLTGDSFTRIPANRQILEEIKGGKEFLDAFIQNRLLSANTEDSVVVVSFVHEAILLHWDRLAKWLENRKTHFQIKERLRTSALLWQDSIKALPEKDHDDLLLAPGTPLNDGKVFLAKHPEELSLSERDYINKSIAKQKEREQRRLRVLRRWIIALSILALVAIGFGFAFWRSSINEGIAKERAITARDQAEEVLDHIVYTLSDQLKPIGRLDIAEPTINRALRYYEEMESEGDLDAAQKLKYVAALDTKGRLVQQRSEYQLAIDAYQKMITLMRQLVESDPKNSKNQIYLSLAYDHTAYLYKQLGQYANERKELAQAIPIIRNLVKKEPDNLAWQMRLSVLLSALGNSLQMIGSLSKASEAHEEALAISKKLVDLQPNNLGFRDNLANNMESMADAYQVSHEYDKALEAYKQALALKGMDIDLDNTSGDYTMMAGSLRDDESSTAKAMLKLGDLYKGNSQTQKAHKLYKKASDLMLVQLYRDPENTEYARILAVCMERLAEVAQSQNDLQEALNQAEKSVEFLRTLSEKEQNISIKRDFATSLEILGKINSNQKHEDKAIQDLNEALGLRLMIEESDPVNMTFAIETASSMEKLGDIYREAGNMKEAEDFYKSSLAALQKIVENNEANLTYQKILAQNLHKMALFYGLTSRESREYELQAASILEKLIKEQAHDSELMKLYQEIQANISH